MDAFALCGRRGTRQKRPRHAGLREQRAGLIGILARQHARGRHNAGLRTAIGSHSQRAGGNGGLTGTDIAQQQAVHHAPAIAHIAQDILERGLLLKLRFDLDQYVNLRPSKLYKGVTSPLANPGDIDFVVVREGTEGLYCGAGGAVRRNTPQEVATEVSINTAYGVERVVRYAFKLAMKRKKHVTLVHKKNVLVNAGDMWQRIVDKVGEEYPEVTHDYQHIDAATIFLVSDPSRFDVILTDNLFGDILTDEAGSVVGGVGYSASGCINASDEFPSMFEPIHGSAPDIAGQNKANPTAAILSAAMLLEHLGFDDAAKKIHTAVEADIEELGSTVRSTDQVGKDILARM